jgi:hypothetical protein
MMDKEEYLRQLYLINQEIREIKKEFKGKWPETPPYESPEHEEWYRYVLTFMHHFPEIEFGFFYSGESGEDLIGRKPIWIDPGIRFKEHEKFKGEEREKLLAKHRRAYGGLLFESVKIVIPIYPDTSKKDIKKLWPRIQKFKKVVYGEIPTPKEKKWAKNIKIYKFGQLKKDMEERTGKQWAPWINLADQLEISPQACMERYNSIKKFLRLNTEKGSIAKSKEKAEINSEHLDCDTCEKRKDCKLLKTGKGSCEIFDRNWKPDLSPQNYISHDDYEAKQARDYGHQEEGDFIDKLDID